MADFEYSNERLDAVLAKAEALFRRRFLDAIRQIQDSTTLAELEELLARRNFEEALVQAELAAVNLSNAYVQAYILAADDVMEFISGSIGIEVSFNQVNTRAVREMQEASLRLVQEFTSGQRASTRRALVEGIRAGLNPRDQARLFRQSIGLTSNQMQSVINYRRLLESGSSRALQRALRDKRFDGVIRQVISGDRVFTADEIERQVQRYYERSIAARAETIARTEALGAVHQGSDQGFREAIAQGLIDDELSQVWHTAGDARVRVPSHTFMNGQIRVFGEPFLSGTGNLLRYPGDQRAPAHDVVKCRCAKSTRFTADVRDPVAA